LSHSEAQDLQRTPERAEFRTGDRRLTTVTTEEKKASGDLNEVLQPWQVWWLQKYWLLSTVKPSRGSTAIGKERN